MKELNQLLAKLEDLDRVLGPGPGDNKDEGPSNMDAFQLLKKEIARDIQSVRKGLQERDDLTEKQPGTREAVEASAKIRRELKDVQQKAQQLEQYFHQDKSKADKGKKGSLEADEVDHRREIVDLVFQHIEEVEQLEKKPYVRKEAGRYGGMSMKRGGIKRSAMETDLKQIDDPEVSSGLMELKQRDQEIDDQLDLISKGVARLKGIAIDIKEETKLQNVMTDEITEKVDNATENLQQLNGKMKEILKKAGGASRIIVYIVLFVVLVGVGAFLFKLITAPKN
mmetsp:Transcript_13347/g.35034  ORF Transcript_13347/g.35034 Transcript_13347/m.35034 type:complete len:282 (-) Transcript_13347:378-1223(-)|eukprot:CAMPEP_0113881364 /NCGR_PEP_ID=MMETSP0780_2-20120614/8334_1 /TAXON_ID=652834 /ORGANISM="Palpitomonas bilix" /LENGTH=281 /DNA_ID=CAMNT_0000868211 /DNA_START=71 /DNA_END=916 /DNA_ORIENTATION=+ /assembly_acc=CAM_ASM_000599